MGQNLCWSAGCVLRRCPRHGIRFGRFSLCIPVHHAVGIKPHSMGRSCVTFLRVSDDSYPEFRVTHMNGDFDFSSSVSIKYGSGPIVDRLMDDGLTNRWGDYLGGSWRENQGQPEFWVIGQYGLSTGGHGVWPKWHWISSDAPIPRRAITIQMLQKVMAAAIFLPALDAWTLKHAISIRMQKYPMNRARIQGARIQELATMSHWLGAWKKDRVAWIIASKSTCRSETGDSDDQHDLLHCCKFK